MFSPLTSLALSLNQMVTDKFNHYRYPIFWSHTEQKFFIDSRSRQFFVWKFINFGIMSCVLFPCSFFIVWDAFKNPGKHNTFWILITAIYAVLCGLLPCFSLVAWKLRLEVIHSVNAVNSIESIIPTNKILHYSTRKRIRKPSRWFQMQQEFSMQKVLLTMQKHIFFNGGVDIVGLIAILAVPIFCLSPIFLSVVTVHFHLDATHYLIQMMFPVWSLASSFTEIMMLLRFFLFYCALMEMCTLCRTFGIIAIATTEAFKNYLSHLITLPPRFQIWNSLQIIFQTANIAVSYFLPIALEIMFIVEILAIAGTVLGLKIMPWYHYSIFPFLIVLGFILMSQFFHQIIHVHRKSLTVKCTWMTWCTTLKSRKQSRLSIKVVDKTFISMKPLAFNYGSLGCFTSATRTDFYHSIIDYSMELLLSCR